MVLQSPSDLERGYAICPKCGRMPIIPEMVYKIKGPGQINIMCPCGRKIVVKRKQEDNGSTLSS